MIINDTIPTTGKKIFTTAPKASFAITTAWFCNTSQDAVEILNLYLVSRQGNVSSTAKIVCDMRIQPTDTMVLDGEKMILEDGDYIYATSLNGTISAVMSAMNLG